MSANENVRKQSSNNENRKMSAKKKKARKRRKIIIFSIEIVLILVLLGVVYTVLKATGGEGPSIAEWDDSDIVVNKDVQEKNENAEEEDPYWTIALFGVDASTSDQLYTGSRSDSTMIASINKETGEIKLVSIYRDTYLNVGTDKYAKSNAAYSAGGAKQAINMLNMNLDLSIDDFVTVGYQALTDVINGLGGVWIDVDSEEIKHINNYQIGVSETLKCDYTPVTETGYQKLDGLQATAYCRIRQTLGDDFKRAERQREVLKAIEAEAKNANLSTLTNAFSEAMPNLYTSIGQDDIIALLGKLADYNISEENGFPQSTLRTTAIIGGQGDCVIPTDLTANVVWLHEFLYGIDGYEVSSDVQEYSSMIESKTSEYVNR